QGRGARGREDGGRHGRPRARSQGRHRAASRARRRVRRPRDPQLRRAAGRAPRLAERGSRVERADEGLARARRRVGVLARSRVVGSRSVAGPATNRSRAPRPLDPLLAAVFFLAVTALMTWPHAAHLGDRMNDLWDAKQNAWILHWDFWQTFHDPGNLFQAPILHPARYALAFSENLYGGAIFGFPLLALGTPVVANYNAVFLFSMAFSAWAAWLLARYVTGDGFAALLAGIVYAFVPWRFAQLPHINMQLGGFLCLLLYFLLKSLDRGRLRDLVLFAVCFAGNLLSTFHYGLFSGF